MATVVQVLGWEVKGLRCPDHKISFEIEDGKVYPITLIQMPNGTGKTTTLELLRAALSGEAAANKWDRNRVRALRKRQNESGRGSFQVVLAHNQRRLTITLEFDFDEGNVAYSTTLNQSGKKIGFHPPPDLRKFLHPKFIRFFVFDGELAEQLLNRQHTDAQTAIEDLFQLGIFSDISNKVNEYWQKQTAGRGATEDVGLVRRRNQVSNLEKRINALTSEKARFQDQLERLEKELRRKKNSFKTAISQQKDIRESLQQAESAYASAKAQVRSGAREVLECMRNPHTLSTIFADEIITFKASLDRVKLPESTAREFFEELAEENICVCGRELDDEMRVIIRERASQYLGSEDIALLNAIKADISGQVGTVADINELRLNDLIRKLSKDCQREDRCRTTRDSIENEGIANDPSLAKVNNEIELLEQKRVALRKELDKYDDMTDTASDDDTFGIKVLQKRLEDANRKLEEISETLALKKRRDVLTKILTRAQMKARSGISDEICSDANERISKLLPSNAIRIERVDQCLILKGQEGGSVGETLSVGYAFLSTLFNRSDHLLPFIVDSPANPIDLEVRAKVAELVPRLTKQFIAFMISSERQGFLSELERAAADSPIQYITLFRKGTENLEIAAKREKKNKIEETVDGLCVNSRNFFHSVHLDSENGNNGV
jgi:DNA sulfur modification protein DndD